MLICSSFTIFLSPFFFYCKLNESVKLNFEQRCSIISSIHILPLIIHIVVSCGERGMAVWHTNKIYSIRHIQSDSYRLVNGQTHDEILQMYSLTLMISFRSNRTGLVKILIWTSLNGDPPLVCHKEVKH